MTVVNDLVVLSTFHGAIFAVACESGEVACSAQVAVTLIAWPAIVGDTVRAVACTHQSATCTAFRLETDPEAASVATPTA